MWLPLPVFIVAKQLGLKQHVNALLFSNNDRTLSAVPDVNPLGQP
jgi:hypothetical protein